MAEHLNLATCTVLSQIAPGGQLVFPERPWETEMPLPGPLPAGGNSTESTHPGGAISCLYLEMCQEPFTASLPFFPGSF